MLVKSIFNRVERIPGFVIAGVRFDEAGGIVLEVRPRKNSWPICSRCGTIAEAYDQTAKRRFKYVPLWQIPTHLEYRMRRVECRVCDAIVTETVPWAVGKETTTKTFQWFIAAWAKRLSWKEVATTFGTTWNTVLAAVKNAVEWGQANADYSGVKAIGVDEIKYQKGTKLEGLGPRYLTLVYQIDQHRKRLLWIGRDRKEQTLQTFFDWFGSDRASTLKFVCSDMWPAYLKVIRERAKSACHVLDRFHVVAKVNKAIDEIRSTEARELRAKNKVHVLLNTRWLLLKLRDNLSESQHEKLKVLLSMNLRVVKAYLLKETLQRFWTYNSPYWAGKFLDSWCDKATRSRILPLKRIARSLRSHRSLLLNWFAAKGISVGAVEGLNNKAKVTLRKSYGFRSYKVAELALYHSLGDLPLPRFTHRFW
jgi:transposase